MRRLFRKITLATILGFGGFAFGACIGAPVGLVPGLITKYADKAIHNVREPPEANFGHIDNRERLSKWENRWENGLYYFAGAGALIGGVFISSNVIYRVIKDRKDYLEPFTEKFFR